MQKKNNETKRNENKLHIVCITICKYLRRYVYYKISKLINELSNKQKKNLTSGGLHAET